MGYFSDKVSPDREKEIIDKVARMIVRKYDMATIATFFLESWKPLVYIQGELGRFFTPLLGIFGTGIDTVANEYIIVFENRENIDRLIGRINEIQEEVKEDSEREKKRPH